jgi:hypothetical protein
MICGTNPIRMIKSKRIRWAGNVARMTGRRNAYWVLAGKLERNSPLEDLELGGKMVLQDTQCTYTVTLWRVRVTTVAVEKH